MINGTLQLIGKDVVQRWTRLDMNAPAGTSMLHLADRVKWASDDKIVLAPSTFNAHGVC